MNARAFGTGLVMGTSLLALVSYIDRAADDPSAYSGLNDTGRKLLASLVPVVRPAALAPVWDEPLEYSALGEVERGSRLPEVPDAEPLDEGDSPADVRPSSPPVTPADVDQKGRGSLADVPQDDIRAVVPGGEQILRETGPESRVVLLSGDVLEAEPGPDAKVLGDVAPVEVPSFTVSEESTSLSDTVADRPEGERAEIDFLSLPLLADSSQHDRDDAGDAAATRSDPDAELGKVNALLDPVLLPPSLLDAQGEAEVVASTPADGSGSSESKSPEIEVTDGVTGKLAKAGSSVPSSREEERSGPRLAVVYDNITGAPVHGIVGRNHEQLFELPHAIAAPGKLVARPYQGLEHLPADFPGWCFTLVDYEGDDDARAFWLLEGAPPQDSGSRAVEIAAELGPGRVLLQPLADDVLSEGEMLGLRSICVDGVWEGVQPLQHGALMRVLSGSQLGDATTIRKF